MGLHHLAIILPLVGPLAHARADVTTTNKMLKRTNGVRNLQILDDTTTDDPTNVMSSQRLIQRLSLNLNLPSQHQSTLPKNVTDGLPRLFLQM